MSNSQPSPRVVTFKIKVQPGGAGYQPKKVTCKPAKLVVKTAAGVQDVTFSLVSDSGNPESTQLWFAREQNQWGNRPGVVVDPVNASHIHFPSSFPDSEKAAFVAAVQNRVSTYMRSTPSNDARSEATMTFDPGQVEPPSPYPALEIDLPYTINYYINVNGISYGPYAYDPEMDIMPT